MGLHSANTLGPQMTKAAIPANGTRSPFAPPLLAAGGAATVAAPGPPGIRGHLHRRTVVPDAQRHTLSRHASCASPPAPCSPRPLVRCPLGLAEALVTQP